MLETNELTQKLRTLLHPRAALIAYSGEKDNSYASDNNYFVEIRNIDDNGMMGEGRPITVDFMNELVRGYSESHSTTPYGRIPPNMLWCDPRKGCERYIWYSPPQKRMMFFKESLQIENAKYNLPGVIYVAGGTSLSIYVYKDKKLTEKTDLYAAPFFNVTGANVCLGSAKIDKPRDLTYKNLLEYWEKKFWLMEFSHLGGGGNPTRSNLVLVTKTAKDKPFNLDLWNVLKAVPTSNYRDYETPLYWMDFGNTQSTGQVVLGTIPKKIKQPASELYKTVDSLKVITRFVKYARVKEADSGPSCSLAEALEKQDLFINSTLAQLGCNILWKMFRNGMIEYHGVFLNLETMKVNPILV